MSFEARYPGRCAFGDRIQVGDLCVYSDDELAHVECDRLQGAATIHADPPLCEFCFTIHRGECI
jgi:hypothetical protein